MDIEFTKKTMKAFSTEDVFKATLEYFNNDDLAAQVWLNKYALKDSQGNVYELTPNDMHRRIAKEIARIEAKYKNSLTLYWMTRHLEQRQ